MADIWLEYQLVAGEHSYTEIDTRLGYGSPEAWGDERNHTIRDARLREDGLLPGDKVWFRVPPGKMPPSVPDFEWSYYAIGEDKSVEWGLSAILAWLKRRFPASDPRNDTRGAPDTADALYNAPQNAEFRARHAGYGYGVLRFKKLFPGTRLYYAPRKKEPPPIQAPVAPAPKPPQRGVPGPHDPPPVTNTPTNTVVLPTFVYASVEGGTFRPCRATDASLLGQEAIKFTIRLTGAVKKTTVKIVHEHFELLTFSTVTKTIVTRTFTSGDGTPYTTEGTHGWEWDGYSDDGVLDTTVLRRGRLTAVVEIEFNGWSGWAGRVMSTDSASVYVRTEAAIAKYVDLKIDRHAKTIEARAHVSVDTWKEADTAGDIGKGLKRVLLGPIFGSIGDDAVDKAVARIKVTPEELEKARACIKEGIEKYWTRLKSATAHGLLFANGDHYDFTLTVDFDAAEHATYRVMRALSETQRPMTAGLAATYCYCDEWMTRFLPIVMPWGEAEAGGRTAYFTKAAAHEFGHLILRDAFNPDWSLLHKGSTTHGQEVLPGRTCPTGHAEIDLMKYYVDAVDFTRVVAAEEDVKGFVSIAGVTIAASKS